MLIMTDGVRGRERDDDNRGSIRMVPRYCCRHSADLVMTVSHWPTTVYHGEPAMTRGNSDDVFNGRQ